MKLQNNQMENEKEDTKMALNDEEKSNEENNSVESSSHSWLDAQKNYVKSCRRCLMFKL